MNSDLINEIGGNSSIYAGMNEVFKHTRQVIDEMQTGDKIGIRDLADKVSSQIELELSNANVMHLVQLFCKQSKEVTVEVGRGGGVYKGGKPKRIDNRPRCPSCNQVIRAELQKQKSEILETSETSIGL